MKRPVWLVIFCALLPSLFAAPPCKTPEELRLGFEACLKAGDTNAFWKLHCWSNVSARDEQMHKGLMRDVVAAPPGTKLLKCKTALGPAPAGSNQPKTLHKGVLRPNIPITGVIGYSAAFKGSVIDNVLEFGKGPDGNFWLVVPILRANTSGQPR